MNGGSVLKLAFLTSRFCSLLRSLEEDSLSNSITSLEHTKTSREPPSMFKIFSI